MASHTPIINPARVEGALREADGLLPMDVEWTRSYLFRLAAANLYDDPLAKKSLEHTRGIRIVVHPDHRLAGLQMLAWIIQRTGWNTGADLGFTDQEEDRFYFETHEGADVTAVVETDVAVAPVAALEFEASNCKVSVTRDLDSPYLQQSLQAGSHRIERATPAGHDTSVELFMDQLSRGGKKFPLSPDDAYFSEFSGC